MSTPHPHHFRPATTHADWTKTDQYHNKYLLSQDEALEFALKNTDANGIPLISVSAAQGKYLYLLAKTLGAKQILEVGTLGAYSTIWMAKALPEGGEIISLEVNPKHAKISTENIAHAGLSSKARVILGPALDSFPTLSPSPPFDLVFIDADKDNNGPYFAAARKLVRTGGVIVVDNVVRNGRVADDSLQTTDVVGVRKLLQMVKDDKGVEATTMSTVGDKGYDGFMYILVNEGI
ncbi:S-adenosyl-L-methionine-dependent methyltransferase [Dacryopinax primogenitus]|uniref:S-adenosyl-L-methionine-dependent methyltransferase n=1 Tax=Dacryopinax primogenitus (strain DJM 731) TaxID=1858805 RepID=M5G653_DACPD|nr:S-adenosyl-L-methionine-dependent methyltransferase [Dacryopinax primogenitus]EJU05736.1 S-adenosyl-L-methionine-dependent methyltransferase [Dacryopinax primogenitus]